KAANFHMRPCASFYTERSVFSTASINLLRRLGTDSMGIYILSGYLLVFLIQRLAFFDHPSYILNVLETVIVLSISWMVTILLGKVPVLKRLVGK
ncbi:MAG: hypothetical protein K2M91_06070, partial [Lachnospiraceae bacterium]|nr:hypothetical protein [Lachnospiraceae bacterium]